MRIAVYGLGYVGSVTASCLASIGHDVTGVDPNSMKVDAIRRGVSPVVEPGLEALVASMVATGQLRAIADAADVDPATDVHIVCVGTPSRPNGSIDLSQVEGVFAEIGHTISRSVGRPVVMLRSTVLPGSSDDVLVPELEAAAGGVSGSAFGFAFCPEFLRETSALDDFFHPPFTVVGTADDETAQRVQAMFGLGDVPFHRTDTRTAELVKYACNSFHALKVVFANEIGRFARSTGADAHRAMEVFCDDHQLNISSAYLRPGFAFGGSCLPKDVRALVHRSRMLDLDLPLITNVLPSNDQHLNSVIDRILDHDARQVALLGLAFKTGTDDLRESPFVRMAERLLGKGVPLTIWDPDLRNDRLVGQNRTYIEETLPHLACLLRPTPADAIRDADLVVVGSGHPAAADALRSSSVSIFDLRGDPELAATPGRVYEGAAW